MSIPTPFNPLGTLGTAKDYIQDGLLLLVDATREPKGQLDSLTNFATGEKIELPAMVENDDGLSGSSGLILPWSKYSTQYTAEVCCKIKLSDSYIDVHPWVNQQSIGDTTIRIKGRAYAKYSDPALLAPNIWPSPSYIHFYSPLPPLGTVLSVCCQWGTEPIVNLISQARTDSLDGIGAPLGAVIKCSGVGGILYSFRLYARSLSTAKREHNYKIDQMKFMK